MSSTGLNFDNSTKALASKTIKTIIHINETLSVAGGVEVYISQLQQLLGAAGWRSVWISMVQMGTQVSIHSESPSLVWEGDIDELQLAPMAKLVAGNHGLFHVHSLSQPSILHQLFQIGPVVRTAHEPRMMCPGHGKFWMNSETDCRTPWGWHCLYHAYREKCCARRPSALIKALSNTRFEKNNVGRYACVIANSNYIAREIARAGMIPDKLEVIPYFAEPVGENECAPATGARILFVGRLARSKGLHYLLDSFVEILKEVPDARLDIAGSGIHQDEFRAQAERLGVSSHVVFHGWTDRPLIKKLLRECKIVAFPSIYPEAFGIVGIEAMMHARPVVAFDVGGVRDWLNDGNTGFLVPPKDTAALATALVHLLKDDAECLRMGTAARTQALLKFSVEKHMSALFEVYEGAMGVHSGK